ncbi:MAG: hypothetical protein HC882_04065 [Acidobacteria bacterium]|nr:hypothetical protein [Acidobacteriota bacterium]
MRRLYAAVRITLLALAWPVPAIADEVLRPIPAPAVERVAGRSDFQVRASRFGLSARYDVRVVASISGLDGALFVELERPLQTRLGVDALAITVRVLDEGDGEVGRLITNVADGTQAFSIPFHLPGSGRYRFLLDDDGLDAGPARVRIEPGGVVEMTVDVSGEDNALARQLARR